MRRSRTPSALAASLQGKAPAAAEAGLTGASAEQLDAPAAKRPRFVAPSRLSAAARTAQPLQRPALAPLANGSTSAADPGDRQYYSVLYTKRSNKVGCSARACTGQHASRRPAHFSNRSV